MIIDTCPSVFGLSPPLCRRRRCTLVRLAIATYGVALVCLTSAPADVYRLTVASPHSASVPATTPLRPRCLAAVPNEHICRRPSHKFTYLTLELRPASCA